MQCSVILRPADPKFSTKNTVSNERDIPIPKRKSKEKAKHPTQHSTSLQFPPLHHRQRRNALHPLENLDGPRPAQTAPRRRQTRRRGRSRAALRPLCRRNGTSSRTNSRNEARRRWRPGCGAGVRRRRRSAGTDTDTDTGTGNSRGSCRRCRRGQHGSSGDGGFCRGGSLLGLCRARGHGCGRGLRCGCRLLHVGFGIAFALAVGGVVGLGRSSAGAGVSSLF